MSDTIQSKGYAARDDSGKLSEWEFERRPVGADDVLIDIKYASVCHSDIHQIHGDWGEQEYPQVPGHEMAGIVTAVGENVTDFEVGDRAGVGCMVNGNPANEEYQNDHEQYAEDTLMTYGTPTDDEPTGITQGGYSNNIVVDSHFVVAIPEEISLEESSPLLCAGITTFAPLMRANVTEEDKVAVVGIGGLGHMALKLAVSMGADVSGFTTTEDKADDIAEFGAEAVVVDDDGAALSEHAGSFDYVICTIPDTIDLSSYVALGKPGATFTQVGMGEGFKVELNNFVLATSRVKFEGSLIGGMEETQDVVDYCAENGVVPQIQMIDPSEVNEAWDKVQNKEARYRFVMDMSQLQENEA